MLERPRFRLEESWDESGDVDLYFCDITSDDLKERVGRELSYFVPQLKAEERTLYHLEKIIGSIFEKMSNSGNLRRNSNRWVWTEEV